MTAALMVQGTGSDVGKSLIVAGLARACANRGMAVRPFKSQNMSNNAAVTVEGGEIGRAQALQARACRVAPSIHMNPVLLKPESERGAQIIVQGKRAATMSARVYMAARSRFLPAILDSFARLSAEADLVLVEGAGSPAEVNLRHGDLANMGFAEALGLPVLLIGDIHRGGVIASIVGTLAVLPPQDAARVRAFLVNNFHGDPALFADGISFLKKRTRLPCAGLVPHLAEAAKLPAEDALALDRAGTTGTGDIHIAVPRLSRLANFDDLDPLRLEPCVTLTIVQPGHALPGDADVVLLPGSKSTVADLAFFREQGWDVDLAAHLRRGGRVIGLCGGYQMLGRAIHDPEGIEGPVGSIDGLGLLEVETTLVGDKTLIQIEGRHVFTGAELAGYEMHLGRTQGAGCEWPFAEIAGRGEGAVSPDARVEGTYLHGVFSSDEFRRAWLARLGARRTAPISYEREVDSSLDALAAHLEAHVDIDLLLTIAAERCGRSLSTTSG